MSLKIDYSPGTQCCYALQLVTVSSQTRWTGVHCCSCSRRISALYCKAKELQPPMKATSLPFKVHGIAMLPLPLLRLSSLLALPLCFLSASEHPCEPAAMLSDETGLMERTSACTDSSRNLSPHACMQAGPQQNYTLKCGLEAHAAPIAKWVVTHLQNGGIGLLKSAVVLCSNLRSV